MPAIVALIVEPEEQEFVRGQLAGVATPRFCDRVEALEAIVAAGMAQAVLADLRDKAGVQVAPVLRRLRSRMPALPIVLCFRPTPLTLREVPDLLGTMPGTGLVLRGFEHVGLAMKKLLHSPRPPSAAETLLRRLVPLTPASLQPFFTVCAVKGSPRLRVPAVAAWSRIPRRTLERRLSEAQLPGAAGVVGAFAALHAAWWLDVYGWPTKQVIEEMQFSHLSSLTRTLKRHFGCSVSQLDDYGGFNVLLLRYEETLRHASLQ
jgi:hypothetical protein